MRTDRVILHIDGNCFYASVEMAEDPSLRGKPMAVCGDPVMRHGIVLAKSYEAKARGIHTGMVVWQAKQICPELILRNARFPLYQAYSDQMFSVFSEYTPFVEGYGVDEGWLELTGRGVTMAEGVHAAREIQARLWEELALPVSIGVSFTKTFAKLGSDYKKPGGITVITPENYREIVWPLPAGDLLFIGEKTAKKLADRGVETIGDLAGRSEEFMRRLFGINGLKLLASARGEEDCPVRETGTLWPEKSIGNSLTFPHDLRTMEEVASGCYLMAESVAARLRAKSLTARCVSLGVRDARLNCASCQRTLHHATSLSGEIARMAQMLFRERYCKMLPLRSMGIYCTSLLPADAPEQLCMFTDSMRRRKEMALEAVKDVIQRRFGPLSILRGSIMIDPQMAALSPKDDHLIHPKPFYTGK